MKMPVPALLRLLLPAEVNHSRSMARFLFVNALALASSARAFQLFPPDSVADYPTQCASVLSLNVTACNNLVPVFDPWTIYDETTLEQSCNDTCASALASWYSQASSACSGLTYDDDYGYQQAISDAIGVMVFNFNQTCLEAGGQYCNIVLGNEISNSTDNSTVSASNGTTPCNMCNLLRLRDTAQSPYGDGPLVYSESLYQSYTSSCGGSFTNYPLTTSPPPPTPAS